MQSSIVRDRPKGAIAHFILLGILLMGLLFGAPAAQAQALISQAPTDAQVYIITPNNGEIVTSPFAVKFGLSGMGIAPAGVDKDNTGHHHLLIDLAELPDLSQPLPATDQIKHFGGGQTETEVTLPPGEHTLQLLLANYTHVPHQPVVLSEPITITVQ
ncbi:DUF4399 domain-containing protein [Leptolyngbya sp. PCC 6406]|uniref:DUF4399 domain-containing protein n=1 Tax=Leptolyngbya sp. PCC 6406 TaxID=1173264 RepID=UPI0002AC0388|nr:DUF4399 domain-containing protein [Leptolyngbya sp. PCC 6406]